MKNKIAFCLLIFTLKIGASPLPEQYLTHISRSIIIKKPLSEVFDHVKDTTHDDTWRTEVNQMDANGPFQVGTTYTEDAHIGFNRNFITRTVLLILNPLEKAYYQTPPDAPYFLSSLREVKKIDHEMTEFTYTVEFDSRMSRETLGLNLPPTLLELSYGVIMKNYLLNLKSYLE
jgi:hypothetical protein